MWQTINKKHLQNIIKLVTWKQAVFAVALVAVVLISVFSVKRSASSAASPESYATDLAGNPKTSFGLGEQGYLNLRAYADGTSQTFEKADVSLILDASSTMDTVTAGGSTRLSDAKAALVSFVNGIKDEYDMRVSLIIFGGQCGLVPTYSRSGDPYYGGIAYKVKGMTEMDSAARTDLVSKINAIDPSYIQTQFGTGPEGCVNRTEGIGEAITMSRVWNIDAGDHPPYRDAKRINVLITDGPENADPTSNGFFFNNIKAEDPYLTPAGGSYFSYDTLGSDVTKRVNYYTIYYGKSGQTCSAPSASSIQSFAPKADTNYDGCAMMRFFAARSNGLSLPGGKTWASDYGQASGIDERFFYKTDNTTGLTQAYNNILNTVAGADGSPIKVTAKTDAKIKYENYISTTDKGGRTYYVPTEAMISGGGRTFYYPSVPRSYYCNEDETNCQKNAREVTIGSIKKYLIENNYIDVKIKFSALSTGTSDAFGNYTGCGTGSLQHSGADEWATKVEYLDRKGESVYALMNFPALCVSFSDGVVSPLKIIKSTFGKEQTLDSFNPTDMKGNFEAGDTVYTRLEISDSIARRDDFDITDELPNGVSGQITYRIKRIGDNKTFAGSANIYSDSGRKYFKITPSTDDDKLPAFLLEGKTIINYEYKI